MAVTQGSFGELKVWDDFLAPDDDLTWGTGGVKVGNFGFVSDDEGSFEWTVDEANGIVAITTDVGDDDSACLKASVFTPSVNGPIVCEWRFKFSNVDCAIFAGFTETLSLTAPVMPAEFATATMTYNGTGQMIGAQMDVDGTTDDFRAVFGDAGAVLSGADANGTRANETLTADEWYIVRVELDSSGRGDVWVGHKNRQLDLIKSVTGNPTTNPMHAILMIENRSGNARVLEVDYGYAKGYRDWEVT